MAHAVTSQSRTPADELRDLLDESEKSAVNMRGAGADQAIRLLESLDRISVLFPELEAAGVDLQPERGRWQAVQGSVRRHGRVMLAELKPAGGLEAVRSRLSSPPPEANWWWQLDAIFAAQRRRKTITWAAATGIVVVILIGGYWLFNRLFPVDPVVAEVYRLRTEAEQSLILGEVAPALASYEAAVALSPDDPEILAWLAALYAANGRDADAASTLERLRPLLPEVEIDSLLATSYFGVQRLDDAQSYIEQALTIDPNHVVSLITAADISQARGQIQEAMAFLERADVAAGEQNLTQEQAVIRIRLAQLLQQPLLPSPAE